MTHEIYEMHCSNVTILSGPRNSKIRTRGRQIAICRSASELPCFCLHILHYFFYNKSPSWRLLFNQFWTNARSIIIIIILFFKIIFTEMKSSILKVVVMIVICQDCVYNWLNLWSNAIFFKSNYLACFYSVIYIQSYLVIYVHLDKIINVSQVK